jgi:hypothetical protein
MRKDLWRGLMLGAVLGLFGCGGDAAGPGEGSGNFQASIDGSAWSADPALIVTWTSTTAVAGTLGFQGSTLGSDGRSLAINLSRIPGIGTYPIGVNIGTATGGIGTLSRGSQGWTTPLSGAAGTLTIATLTEDRVSGTFSFEMDPVGTSGPRIAVTNGRFDLPMSPGFVAATPAQLGSRVSGSIAATAWNAATVATSGAPGTLFVATASNDAYMVSLTMGPVTGSGPLSTGVPARRVSVQRIGGPGTWGGTAADQGTLTITSLAGGRMVGTVSASLAGTAGTVGTLVLQNIAFDLRLDP